MREPDLHELVTGSAEAAFVVGSEGTILSWNRAAEKLFAIPANDALNRNCAAVLRCADSSGEHMCPDACPLLGMSKQGVPVQAIDLEVGKPDHRQWVNVSTLSIRIPAKNVIIHLARDINAQKRLVLITRMFLEQICSLTGHPVDTLLNAAPMPHAALTERERQILQLLTQGKSTSAIAGQFDIATVTVRNHVRNILQKLHAHSRTQAVACSLREHET